MCHVIDVNEPVSCCGIFLSLIFLLVFTLPVKSGRVESSKSVPIDMAFELL